MLKTRQESLSDDGAAFEQCSLTFPDAPSPLFLLATGSLYGVFLNPVDWRVSITGGNYELWDLKSRHVYSYS